MIKIAFLCLVTFSLLVISLQQEEEDNVRDEPNCKKYREIVSFRINSFVMTTQTYIFTIPSYIRLRVFMIIIVE